MTLTKIITETRIRLYQVIRWIWKRLIPPVCSICEKPITGMVMGISLNYLAVTRYCYDCYKYKLLRRTDDTQRTSRESGTIRDE